MIGREAAQRALRRSRSTRRLTAGADSDDLAGDVVVGPTAVVDEQRKNLTVNRVHVAISCAKSSEVGIGNRPCPARMQE